MAPCGPLSKNGSFRPSPTNELSEPTGAATTPGVTGASGEPAVGIAEAGVVCAAGAAETASGLPPRCVSVVYA